MLSRSLSLDCIWRTRQSVVAEQLSELMMYVYDKIQAPSKKKKHKKIIIERLLQLGKKEAAICSDLFIVDTFGWSPSTEEMLVRCPNK